MTSFDRHGEIFRSFDGAFSLYQNGDKSVMDGKHPYWSWTRAHAHNVQTNTITRLEQVAAISGGYRMRVNDPDMYDSYLTQTALGRMGS
jgi:hypothetical protein